MSRLDHLGQMRPDERREALRHLCALGGHSAEALHRELRCPRLTREQYRAVSTLAHLRRLWDLVARTRWRALVARWSRCADDPLYTPLFGAAVALKALQHTPRTDRNAPLVMRCAVEWWHRWKEVCRLGWLGPRHLSRLGAPDSRSRHCLP